MTIIIPSFIIGLAVGVFIATVLLLGIIRGFSSKTNNQNEKTQEFNEKNLEALIERNRIGEQILIELQVIARK